MSANIELDGFEDLEEYIQDMTLTESDKTKAMKAAIKPVYDKTNNETPISSERLKKSEKMQVKKEGFATVGLVRYGVFWDVFNEFEYGSSKNKSHVGFFEKAVNESTDEAIKILAEILLDKGK